MNSSLAEGKFFLLVLQVADQGSDDGAEVKKDTEGLHIKARGRHAEEIEKNAQVRSTGHRDKLRHPLYQPVKQCI